METPTEKLKAMLDTGKITVEQYHEMLKSIPDIATIPSSALSESSIPASTAQSQIIHRPWQVWFCSIFLLVVAVIDLFSGMFLAMVICVAIAVPLFYRNRIAYVIIQIIGIVTIIYCILYFSIHWMIINTAFVIILSSVWKYYFIRSE